MAFYWLLNRCSKLSLFRGKQARVPCDSSHCVSHNISSIRICFSGDIFKCQLYWVLTTCVTSVKERAFSWGNSKIDRLRVTCNAPGNFYCSCDFCLVHQSKNFSRITMALRTAVENQTSQTFRLKITSSPTREQIDWSEWY